MISGLCPSRLKYAVRRSGRSVAYCALSIGAGTRDEAGFPAGVAHFTEHAMFRGTTRKSASVISSYLDRLGGELNAYTTKEEIVLHATVLKEDLAKAVRLLFELATDATFPDDEIETERGVILDEIISYKDNPA
ncbi:MAG: insulinase family protein, partial [Bacteroidales bacterium]|nr:insulinase family protein [Bacteroidales bacterium]